MEENFSSDKRSIEERLEEQRQIAQKLKDFERGSWVAAIGTDVFNAPTLNALKLEVDITKVDRIWRISLYKRQRLGKIALAA